MRRTILMIILLMLSIQMVKPDDTGLTGGNGFFSTNQKKLKSTKKGYSNKHKKTKFDNYIYLSLDKSIYQSQDCRQWYKQNEPESTNNPEKSKLLIAPNPATDYITINPDNKGLKPFAESDEQVEIYNSFGELVLKEVPHLQNVAHLLKIDVSHLPVGLYFVKIGDKVEKFVKM